MRIILIVSASHALPQSPMREVAPGVARMLRRARRAWIVAPPFSTRFCASKRVLIIWKSYNAEISLVLCRYK